jgi:hypothetical protein
MADSAKPNLPAVLSQERGKINITYISFTIRSSAGFACSNHSILSAEG